MRNRFYPAKKFKWIVWPLKDIKEMILKRRENKKDNVILVTGARGDGKSTFTGKILFMFDDFNPYEQMVYSKDKMFELIKKKNGYIWADEAVVNAARGNVMTKANKMLHEIVTINRDNFNIVFFCLPFIEDFDSKILQYVSMWVHIDSRGLGVMLLPANKGIFGKKNWDIDSMRKIYEEFVKENQKAYHVPYWIYPNFRGYIRFGKLSPKQEQIVNEIKQLRKNENTEKEKQEQIVTEVKKLENYTKYAAKKLTELLLKGEIRNKESFQATCAEMKIDPMKIEGKINSLLKRNGVKKTMKGLLREYEEKDALINF